MHKHLLFVAVVGCATSAGPTATTPTTPTPLATGSEPTAGATGGATYGGATYGGATYGGAPAVEGADDPEGGDTYVGGLGHGAGPGTGQGVGAARSRTTAAPVMRIGQPQSVGDLDKAIIRRYIKRNLSKIMYCYEKQLLAAPGLEGIVNAQFFIAPDGKVTHSNANGVNGDVSSCVANVISTIEFPKPKGGGGVQVNYPFNFRPTGG
ncbi:MAG: AgmX/PglI C-terminal domain-containing protein [Proteobacteria bacterium]|nr:AgmX/PglI C-terminal domain-containing protein [Pseudomonadota bacterium]